MPITFMVPSTPEQFGRVTVIETKDEKIADAIRAVCNYPWGADHEVSQQVVPGHGPQEVIALRISPSVLGQLKEMGYEPADPITTCKFIERTGWPGQAYYGGDRIGTVWNGTCFCGFSFKSGARFDADPQEKCTPSFWVMAKTSPAK